MKLSMLQLKLLMIAVLVLMQGACGTLQVQNAEGLSKVAGDKLPGTQGLTLQDQDNIDDTVARLCAANVLVKEKCAVHTEASIERRASL